MAPALWSGLAFTMMNAVSPILSGRVDWIWFIASQMAYGVVAGWMVAARSKVNSAEFKALSFGSRAGLHTDEGRRNQGKKDEGRS